MFAHVCPWSTEESYVYETKKKRVAGTTGLEPATSDVTGRRSNQLSYVPAMSLDNQIVTRTPPVHQIARRGIL